jgi:hypothetical protein
MPTLNVVLHGLFSLVKRGDQIFALAPVINDQHVYRAGSWLSEVELRRGFYMLTGVRRGQAVFDTTANLVLSGKTMSPQASCRAFATILFPQPKTIYSLRTVKVLKGGFSGNDNPNKDINLSTIQVFVYDCDDLTSISLSGHPFETPEDPGTQLFNLHVFSEEDVDPDDLDHSVNAFDEAVTLFKNVDLHMKDPHPIPPPAPGEVLPNGVLSLELECMGHRQDRMDFLGRTLREILSSPKPDFSRLKKVFDAGFAHGGELQSCSFPIVDEG